MLEALEQAAAPYTGIRVPDTDAVHGDWSLGNLLAGQGQITGIVDCAHAGYGTRAIDLASVLHDAYAGEYDDGRGQTVRSLLRDEILSLGGTPLLVILLIYRAMALVEFAVRQRRLGAVAEHIEMGWRIISDFR